MPIIKPEYISSRVNIHDLLPLSYLKKTSYTGSKRDMRYKMEKKELADKTDEEGKPAEGAVITAVLRVWVWFTPFAFDKTDDSEKISADFAFSDEGIRDSICWLNEQLDRHEEGK